MNTNRLTEIFIRNLTVLDCAVAVPRKGPQGRSWYVDVKFKGHTDEEGIVFDFSLAKKAAKEVIDTLFDHRLLTPESSVTYRSSNRVHISLPFEVDSCSSYFAMDCYPSAVAILPDAVFESLQNYDATPALESIIASEIQKSCPTNIVEITVRLRTDNQAKEGYHFSYTHSLKHHYGNCQRFHGHSNIVEVLDGHSLNEALSLKAARFLDNGYLVSADYISPDLGSDRFTRLKESIPDYNLMQSDYAGIHYQGSQGPVTMILPRRAVMVMPSESTIENIASFIRSKLKIEQKYQVVAYEGLQKGSLG